MTMKTQLYSPQQIALGSFWGGPFAAVYFLKENFLVLNQPGRAKRTLQFGALISGAMIGVLPFLPDKFPNLVMPLAYCIAARELAKVYQLKKEAIATSDLYTFRSNWRVFG